MIHNLAEGVSAFTSNAFLVEGERTVLVDTGANFDIVAELHERVDTLDTVVLTHTHPDHVGNVDAVCDAFSVETWGFDPDQPTVDNAIADESTVQIGDGEYLALHTPGHKNDHLCFYSEEASTLFAGDLVFQNGGFGRTDLPEGNRELLIESIDRLRTHIDGSLSAMHVGHGPSVLDSPSDHVEMAARAARLG
ncbi:flavoprotein [Haloprofundus marisrubri]|uniref:Flavoprotein n=1 Tax=Haloprofundus marisrubri TaxID=1514971 RepID=A0A0W1R555_9EURY|nr:MBL fold metallo-hydrolase [Haloprofundus marisrubri]KTG08375.1 flavoprotein [Haloprofundus marisrubri]